LTELLFEIIYDVTVDLGVQGWPFQTFSFPS